MSLRNEGEVWLPEGHRNDLHIHRSPGVSAGSLGSGGPKIVLHITVSPWDRADSMNTFLHSTGNEPHFVIGGREGADHPIVYQQIKLNETAKCLRHPAGTLPTNGANAIQIEICAGDISMRGRPGWKDSDIINFWPSERYDALANLIYMIRNRVPVPNKLARRFNNTKRFSGAEFVRASGICGHMHVPGNDHIDPTIAFKGSTLTGRVKSAPHNL